MLAKGKRLTFGRILAGLWRYGRSPSSVLAAFRAIRDRRCILRSEFFDPDWIRRQHVDLRQSGADPAFACLINDVDPSRDFCCREYLALHGLPAKGVNALVHYERVGKRKGFAVSYLDQKAHNGALEGIRDHLKLNESSVRAIHERALKRIREKQQKGIPVRVVFFVFNASMFPGRPLLDAMLDNAAYEPKIAVVPGLKISNDPDDDARKCKNELLDDYAEGLFIETQGSADCIENADMVCYPSPYDSACFRYDVRWSLYHEALPIYFNYSYVVAKFSIEVFSRDVFSCFWRVFFEHKATMDEYARVSVCKGSNAVLVGYLKMDALQKCRNGASSQSKRKLIIVAPHHSFRGGHNDCLLISNFLEYAEYFQELPKCFPEVDFVFRPHPHFRSALSKDCVWGKVRTDEYFSRLLANDNVALSTEDGYFDLFARSDGLIQDCGSFLAEYFYTGKPQCYLLRSPQDAQRAFTPFGLSCLERCYKAFSKDDVDTFIRGVVLQGDDPLRASRDLLSHEIALNYPHVAQVVLAHISGAIGNCCAE